MYMWQRATAASRWLLRARGHTHPITVCRTHSKPIPQNRARKRTTHMYRYMHMHMHMHILSIYESAELLDK